MRRRDYTEPPPTPSHPVALTSHCWRLGLAEVLRGRYSIREGDERKTWVQTGKGMEAWPAICAGCRGVKEAESNRPGGEAWHFGVFQRQVDNPGDFVAYMCKGFLQLG